MSDRCRDWAWNVSQSEGTSRLVLLRIAELIDDAIGWVDPTIDLLAETVRTKRRSVQRAIRDLETLGDIAVENLRGRRGANRYSMPACPALEDDPRQDGRMQELMARKGMLRLPDRTLHYVVGNIGDYVGPVAGDVVGIAPEDTPLVPEDTLEGVGLVVVDTPGDVHLGMWGDDGDGLRPSRAKNARGKKNKTKDKSPSEIGEASSPTLSKKEAAAARAEERVAISQRILDAVVEIQGYPIANYARTRKGIYDMMAAGYSEAEILAAWRICQDSDWHKAHAAGVSAQLVFDRIGPLRKEGRLPVDPSGEAKTARAAVRWGL